MQLPRENWRQIYGTSFCCQFDADVCECEVCLCVSADAPTRSQLFGSRSVKLCVCLCVSVEWTEMKCDSWLFHISALMHPQGLKNLVLFGSRQGRLQLWNVNTSKLLYTFTGWDSPVTTMQQVVIVVVVVDC